MSHRIRKTTWILAAAMLAACGGGGNEHPLPANSTMQISPTEISWEITPDAGCPTQDPNFYNDETVTVSVLDSKGRPLGRVGLFIDVDLSGTTFSGLEPRVALYDDLNGNGKVDHPAELVSSDTDGGFFTETGEFTGSKTVFVRVYLSCTYKATLSVTAGYLSASMPIDVKAMP